MTENKTTEVKTGSAIIGEPVFAWEALERPHRKLGRRSFSTLIVIVASLAILFLFFKEFWLVICMFSLVFLFYALGTTKPNKVRHTLTTEGISLAGKIFYKWEEIAQAWFDIKYGEWLLVLRLRKKFPGIVLILLGETPYDKIQAYLQDKGFELLDTPPRDSTDKVAERLGKYLNLG